MLAAIASNPVLALDKSEAELVAKGIANVARNYDVPGVSQITLDWVALIQALGVVYGTRIVVMSRAKKAAPKTPPVEVKPVETERAGDPPKPVGPVAANIPGLGTVAVHP